MKENQVEKSVYERPTCSVMNTCIEHPLCAVSVRPSASGSYEGSWDADQTHEGSAIIGDGSGIAPAKQHFFWDEEEEDF